MDLKNAYPYWVAKTGLIYAFRTLDADLRYYVALGAVITCTLVADEFAGHGHVADVLDQRDILWS